MRVCILCVLPLFVFFAGACKSRHMPQQGQADEYRYVNSAFSKQPGEAWSGDAEAMLRDMDDAIKKGNYGKMFRSGEALGFSGRFSQSLALRPLAVTTENGETAYALESAACGAAMAATPYEAVREIFNRKYAAHSVFRQP